MPALTPIPLGLKDAQQFIRDHHRHNKPPVGHKWSIGALHDYRLVGVLVASRPVARMLADRRTIEVVRCCVLDDAPKGTCSFLYSRAWRIWREMGGSRMLTYTLQEESGASLRGAGWNLVLELKGSKTDGWQNRPGRLDQEVVGKDKYRWEVSIDPDLSDIRRLFDPI